MSTTHPTSRWTPFTLVLRFGVANLLFAAMLAFPAPVQAAMQSEKPAAKPAQSQLVETPVTVEELGVSIRVPMTSAVSRERGTDGLTSLTIIDNSPSPVWQIRVQALIPTIENPTPELLIQDHVSKLKEAGHDLQVLNSKEVTVSGVKGWQAFLSDMAAEEPLVNGYLILPGQGPPFIVVSFVCTMMDFATMRGTIEASLASVKIDSPQRINDEREAKLKAGQALVDSFDTATLRGLIGLDQWFRHYNPKPADPAMGEVEIGVSHVWVREGKRGELSPERDPKKYNATENQVGLLLTVQARIVVDRDRDRYYDSLAMYWMSWDDRVEAWSIVATLKQKGNAVSESETGLRQAPTAGEPNGVLEVVKSGAEGVNRTPGEWTLPEYYLSQPLSWLIGHLIASNHAAAGDYSFYAYDSTLGSLSLRTETWAPNVGGGGVMTTKMSQAMPAVTAEYDHKGNLVRRERPDGSITVPTTIEAIKRLWTSKGLNLGSTN